MALFEYTGPIYVRPIGRGICLIDHPNEEQIEDLLPDGYYAARIVIEPLSPAGREAVANRQTGKE